MLLSALQRTAQHVSSVIERANLELARRETILAGMAEGVLAVDQHLKVTFCNEVFARSVPDAPASAGRASTLRNSSRTAAAGNS